MSGCWADELTAAVATSTRLLPINIPFRGAGAHKAPPLPEELMFVTFNVTVNVYWEREAIFLSGVVIGKLPLLK